MKRTAYVSFGSNIGDAKKNIKDAVDSLGRVPGITVEAVSELYETKPWGYVSQDNFVNACARLRVNVSAFTLLGACLGIEAGLGRIRSIKNGPRIVDIDLLMYEGENICTEELTVPHPRMFERDFVLVPLADVAQGELKNVIKEKIENLQERFVLE